MKFRYFLNSSNTITNTATNNYNHNDIAIACLFEIRVRSERSNTQWTKTILKKYQTE